MNKPKGYWEDPKWFEDRNTQLIKDKKAGMSTVELVQKYGITPTRIYYIIKNERIKNGSTQ